jgi:tetratricopeptide (TPR) repeat protein
MVSVRTIVLLFLGIGLLTLVSACSKAPAEALSTDIAQLISENKITEADEFIKAALVKNPRDPNLLYNHSVVNRLQGNLVEARSEASKALSYAPNDPSIKLLLAEYALEFGETSDALDIFQTLPAETRAQPRALAVRGIIYTQQRKWDEAILSFQNAIQLGNQSASTYAALANAYVHKGSVDEAKKALQNAESQSPTNPGDIRQIAEAYLAVSDAQKARDLVLPLSKSTPNDARVWSLIGRAEMILLRFSEAESAFTRAITSPNTTPWHLVEYAMMLFAAQREDEALEKAAAAESQLLSQGEQFHNPSLYNLLATLYARDGQWLLANKYLSQSLQIDGNQPKVRELIIKIKEHFNADSPAENDGTNQ